ncbi:hypothetical protein ACJMK2_007630 [Sinanodonta woodiana]|uniref:Disease resistance R13L4/SHOC-2-like LRR domain-containing protein n=1 Tax=Sinanodonta woodiana TaxID=1069815 RepID=A0ABD3VJ43_SINWO
MNSNPVATCNDTIMLTLGRRLVSFGLGAKEMLTWPSGMKNFMLLRILHIHSINTDNLPPSAFQPFQGQLLQLHLVATKMTHLPHAICDMTSLTTLQLKDTSMSTSDSNSFFPQCSHNLTRLQQFYINHDDSLQHFPSLPKYLPNLQVVQVIDVQRLEFIREEDILESNTNLPFLKIEGCSLQHAPSAIAKFSKLQILSLRRNKLVTIDTFDFIDYPSLKQLDLSENPLMYVSPEAFANLTSLTVLSLSRTNITTLPRALAGISTLQTLEVENTKVECGCDLAWLKGWVNRINMTKLHGKCYQLDQDIAQFIQGDFSYC